jgi:hypothetical protein
VDTFVLVALVIVTTAVHEAGHWLGGRAAGVPARAMRVRLGWPPRVDLRDGDGWVSPMDYARYVAIAERHLPTTERAFVYVAGGPVVETAVVTAACVAAVSLGAPGVALAVAATALGLHALYTAGDLALTWRRGTPCGDASALWAISPAGAVAVTAGALGIQAALVAWAAGLS